MDRTQDQINQTHRTQDWRDPGSPAPSTPQSHAPHKGDGSSHPPPYPSDADSDRIKSDIDHTRHDMDETLEALGDRLHPRHLVEEFFGLFRGGGGNGGHSSSTQAFQHAGGWAWQKVRHHPMPAALMGAGLVWLMCEDDESSMPRRGRGAPEMYGGSYVDARTGKPYDASYGEEWQGEEPGAFDKAKGKVSDAAGKTRGAMHRAGDAMHRASDKTSHAAESARGTASRAAHRAEEWGEEAWDYVDRTGRRVRHGAASLGHRVEEGYYRGRDGTVEAVDDYPLAACAATLGLGLLAGFVLPHSRREDRLMGEESDEMKHRAKETGEEMMERGQQVASATASAAAEEARRQGLTPDQLSEKGKHVAEDIGGAARESAKDEGLTASALKEKTKNVAERTKETAKQESKNQKNEAKRKHS